MKILLLIALSLVVLSVKAQAPPKLVLDSCLTLRAMSAKVSLVDINNTDIYEEEDQIEGRATFYQLHKGIRFGYVTDDRRGDEIVFGRRHMKIKSAIVIGKGRPERLSRPELGFWAIIEAEGKRFLCVASTFDGIGRSGSFQNIHFAYILPVSHPQRKDTSTKLDIFYTVGDIRKIGRRQGKQKVNATP